MQRSHNNMTTELATIIKQPTKKHLHSVIWMHGLGADGNDFYSLLPMLKCTNNENIKWIFPNAPMAAVTINGGLMMRSWYDITSENLTTSSNLDDIQRNSQLIINLIDKEVASLGSLQNIHLAGFSQGGLMALNVASKLKVASCLALSCYHPQPSNLKFNADTKVMQMHGDNDDIIAITRAKDSFDAIYKNHKNSSWIGYAMAHELCQQQVLDIDDWFLSRINN